MIIAIPYKQGEYLNFWKLVKIDAKLYAEAYMRCPDIVKLDGVADKEAFLKYWKRLLMEKTRDFDKFGKARAMIKTIGSTKQYQKTILKSLNEKIIGTTVL